MSTTQPLVETYSYRNGWLTGIDFNGKNVWHLAGEGTFGNTTSTSSWLSNTYYLRDNNGRIQTKYDYIRNSANGTTVTPHQYTYDIHGRIASKDGKAYGYDSFNQLTSWNGNDYTYDELGNITKSGGQGSISYNGYQLQSVAAPDAAVWGKGNLHMQNNGHNMPYCITLKKRNGDCISRMNFNYDAEGRRLYAKKENYLTQPTIVNHENIEPEMQFDYNRIYLDDRFEFIDKRSPASTGYLYIGGDTRTACAVAEINQNNVKLWQIFRDEQGSITAMSDSANIRRFYYDPWGRYCDSSGSMSDSIYANGGNAGMPFYRGFLGQEHYLDFGLVNLNARLYSPFQGRFLANDPVFDPSVSILRFNPYIYANNCPSMYVDPDGEFAFTIINAITDALMNVLSKGINFSAYDWHRTYNSWKIDMGMFKGSLGQILNKWTWNLPNSFIGGGISQLFNFAGLVDEVTEMDGMLALSGNPFDGAMTIGHYSYGPDNYRADWRDHLFVHEYGHYIQSQSMGIAYMPAVAVPSLFSAWFMKKVSGIPHKNRWFEVHASKLGGKYFDKHYGSCAEGYRKNSKDYFDLDSFVKGGRSPYINPRFADYGFPQNREQDAHPISNGTLSFWDFILL